MHRAKAAKILSKSLYFLYCLVRMQGIRVCLYVHCTYTVCMIHANMISRGIYYANTIGGLGASGGKRKMKVQEKRG